MLIVWALTGIWHGASWNYILWGLYFFVFLVLERFVLKKVLERLPRAVGWIYAMLVVYFGWVLFKFENMAELGNVSVTDTSRHIPFASSAESTAS